MGEAAKKLEQKEFVSRAEFMELVSRVESLQGEISLSKGQEDAVSIVAFSGALDKMIATFVIATGAAASGMKVNLFFTFWGTAGFKKTKSPAVQKPLMGRLFGWMLPRGSEKLPLSQMNMGGMGAKMIRGIMKEKNVSSLEELIDLAAELGVEVNICEMSMDLMGIVPEEIRDYPGLGYCGVAKFLEQASRGKMTLFI